MIVVLNTYNTFKGIILINCDYFVILFSELQLNYSSMNKNVLELVKNALFPEIN